MLKNILVTGGSGLVGNAIREEVKNLKDFEDFNFVFLASKDCDLRSLEQTKNLFEKYTPHIVIHLAGNVGGLYKNINKRTEMFEDNYLMNFNVLHCCRIFKVARIISCLSTCIFPDRLPEDKYPLTEEALHEGAPHSSNYPYAYAKRMIDIQTKVYAEHSPETKYINIIPTNIYGKYDNFSLEDGHVIPSLIHKCFLAKLNNEPFKILGSGSAKRQFIYSKDIAILIFKILKTDFTGNIILAGDEEVSIKDTAIAIAKKFDYEDKLVFDPSQDEGQYKKTVSNQLLKRLVGNYIFVDLEKGISETVDWFVENFESVKK